MGSLSLHVRYRPVRIGWCVESERFEHLQSALRLTHAFAGGRFNPVIPVDRTELAEYLVDRFRVDLLFAVADTDAIAAFVQAHDYLYWPESKQALFDEAWQHIPPRGAFVDVYHPARRLHETRIRRRKLLLHAWEDDDPKLKPHNALEFLLERGVFRVGLELTCRHCELPFWLSLDEAKTTAECVYCGRMFGIAAQLKDRDWAFRRSGLFGRNDNQEGGIPVALTLQQLDTALSMDRMLYTTSLELKPEAEDIDKCETDFVVFANGQSHNMPYQPQLVIGECKAAGGTITRQDAEHLAKVADTFPYRRLNVFILFAKPGSFSAEEVEACSLAQHKWHQRVILLGKDELEPYHIDDRYPEGVRLHLENLEDLAGNTVRLYPQLRCKGIAERER